MIKLFNDLDFKHVFLEFIKRNGKMMKIKTIKQNTNNPEIIESLRCLFLEYVVYDIFIHLDIFQTHIIFNHFDDISFFIRSTINIEIKQNIKSIFIFIFFPK